MREIKFRGKRLDNGEWVYGDYHHRAGGVHCIIDMQPDFQGKVVYVVIQVDDETVGQFTGFKDDFGNEIYEGDIVADVGYPFACSPRKVEYDAEEGVYKFIGGEGYLLNQDVDEMKLLGNIHDNPELLKSL